MKVCLTNTEQERKTYHTFKSEYFPVVCARMSRHTSYNVIEILEKMSEYSIIIVRICFCLHESTRT